MSQSAAVYILINAHYVHFVVLAVGLLEFRAKTLFQVSSSSEAEVGVAWGIIIINKLLLIILLSCFSFNVVCPHKLQSLINNSNNATVAVLMIIIIIIQLILFPLITYNDY